MSCAGVLFAERPKILRIWSSATWNITLSPLSVDKSFAVLIKSNAYAPELLFPYSWAWRILTNYWRVDFIWSFSDSLYIAKFIPYNCLTIILTRKGYFPVGFIKLDWSITKRNSTHISSVRQRASGTIKHAWNAVKLYSLISKLSSFSLLELSSPIFSRAKRRLKCPQNVLKFSNKMYILKQVRKSGSGMYCNPKTLQNTVNPLN